MADVPSVELGNTGLKHSYGLVQEEFLVALQGDRANKVYREMGDNDPIAGAVLYAFENMVRQVTWTATGSRAKFVEENMNGMSHSWDDFIAEALSKLQYGWAYHEIVYENRNGRVMWRKLPIRGQDTLARWEFDEHDGIQGMYQYAAGFKQIKIPIERALHFRTSAKRNNPQGRSVLRTAYRPWWFKKRIEEIEAIGVERDLAGIPIIEVPAELLSSSNTDAVAAVAEFKNIVQNLRNDEQAGLVVPQAYDDKGNKLYTYGLMSSNGRRQFVTGEIVQRYSQQIAMASMADVILLGHEQVGSFALSSDKSRLLTIGLQAQVNEIASVLNKHALPRLFELNGIDQQNTQIVAGEIAQVDITALAEMIYKLSLAGMPLFPSEALSAHVRALADLPDADGTENLVTSQMSTVGTLEAAEDAAENPAPVVNPVMEKLADAAVVKLLQPQGVRINRDENGMIDGWEAV
jgi:hypothetical protein